MSWYYPVMVFSCVIVLAHCYDISSLYGVSPCCAVKTCFGDLLCISAILFCGVSPCFLFFLARVMALTLFIVLARVLESVHVMVLAHVMLLN